MHEIAKIRVLAMGRIITGPVWKGKNWSAHAGAGSIHDDQTATGLGFRGGTVAGDVHMNQFPPVLLQAFGPAWFEIGHLSLDFRNATVDGEAVQVFLEQDEINPKKASVWMERDDGMLVCRGTAAVEDHDNSELGNRDLRASDPSALTLLRKLEPGMVLSKQEICITPDKQFERFDAHLISDPLDFYRTGSHWGGVIACPSTLVEFMWGPPTRGLGDLVGAAVGLFGAIEVRHVQGPVLINHSYLLESQIISLGESPKTEYFWFDSSLSSEALGLVATFRMQLRFMKPTV